MSVQATNHLTTQSTTQTASVTETQTQASQSGSPTAVHNPAAEHYASQSMGIQSPGDPVPPPPGQSALEEEVYNLQHELLSLDIDIEYTEQTIEDLTLLIEAAQNGELNPPLSAEEIEELIALKEEARHLLLNLQMQRESKAGLLERRQEELAQFQSGTTNDWDGDGLVNEYELEIGTDPWKVDTDGDGISDLVEDAMRRNGGLPVDPTQYSSTPNGVSDGVVFYDEAQEAAAQLGVPVNGPVGSGGSGGSVPTIGGGSSGGSSVGGTSPTPDPNSPPPPPPGPSPSGNATQVGFTGQSQSTGSQSSGAMSVQSTGGTMGIQDGGEGEEPADGGGEVGGGEPITDTKFEIADDLESHTYTAEETEIVEPQWTDGSMTQLEDVVVNLTEGSDRILVTQDGNDIIIRIRTESGEYRKIVVREGLHRKIFFTDHGGNDVLLFKNVDLQVIHGATAPGLGWVSGIFLPSANGGNSPAAQVVQNTNQNEDGTETSQWGYDWQSNSADDEAPAPTPQNTGIENVWTIWDFGRNHNGSSSNRLEQVGDPTWANEGGQAFQVEEWQMSAGDAPVHLHHPETINEVPVKEIVLIDNGNDRIYVYKDAGGRILKKVIIRDAIPLGNTAANGTMIIDHLPDGLNDPLGYYDQEYRWGGVRFDASNMENNFVHVVGGAGHDWIKGSNYDNAGRWDFLEGGAGNDIIEAARAATIYGGYADPEANMMVDQDIDSDVIKGSQFDDEIHGGYGNDFIHGGYGADSLFGEGGDDFLVTDGGGNTIDGGVGEDTTNVAREYDDDGNTVFENVENALDNIVAAHENAQELLDSFEDLEMDAETRAALEGLIQEAFTEGTIDQVGEAIERLFSSIWSNRTASWNGEFDDWTAPDMGALSGGGSVGDGEEEGEDGEEEPEPAPGP